jgi:hypothetical protein
MSSKYRTPADKFLFGKASQIYGILGNRQQNRAARKSDHGINEKLGDNASFATYMDPETWKNGQQGILLKKF